jgi:two-component system chemotaxis response regulator CheB
MKARASKEGRIRVLIVDDSAVVRQVLGAVLSREADMDVVVAQEPLIALRKMREALPDVILLDLQMPRMDGLTFLRRIRAYAIPVVICSAFSGANTHAAVRALEYGAIDIVQKPELGLREFLDESSIALVELVRAAAHAGAAGKASAPRPTGKELEVEDASEPRALFAPLAVAPRAQPKLDAPAALSERVIAIGASMGGTAALHKVLAALPLDCPGLAIVQHMPAGFTAAFAQRLNEMCRIEVREAVDGDTVRSGTALIAPGNHHLMVLRRPTGGYCVQVRSGAPVNRHRPSVDVLFRSVASAVGANAVGVLLTGMGNDGADGMLEMRKQGAPTIAQDEASCVVYGMPKEAVLRGAVDVVAPLGRIPQAILTATRTRMTARGDEQ